MHSKLGSVSKKLVLRLAKRSEGCLRFARKVHRPTNEINESQSSKGLLRVIETYIAQKLILRSAPERSRSRRAAVVTGARWLLLFFLSFLLFLLPCVLGFRLELLDGSTGTSRASTARRASHARESCWGSQFLMLEENDGSDHEPDEQTIPLLTFFQYNPQA